VEHYTAPLIHSSLSWNLNDILLLLKQNVEEREIEGEVK
jgi:hypothetical protein